jgi:hypothetical protein
MSSCVTCDLGLESWDSFTCDSFGEERTQGSEVSEYAIDASGSGDWQLAWGGVSVHFKGVDVLHNGGNCSKSSIQMGASDNLSIWINGTKWEGRQTELTPKPRIIWAWECLFRNSSEDILWDVRPCHVLWACACEDTDSSHQPHVCPGHKTLSTEW